MKFNILNFTAAMLCGFMALTMTSCDDWLSVQPKEQVEDTELFKSQNGFKEALAGVYSAMVNEATYSKELAFGMMGVLAKEWYNVPNSYQDLSEYDYSKTAPTAMIAAIWDKNYNAIANVNNILKHIDSNTGIFTGDNHDIIKGEALALRAYLHFDLLRCFGVSYEVNPSMPAIPYCTELTYRVHPQLKVSDVTEKILTDLGEAESLLKNDPILTGREVTELDDAGYLINRTLHMNYYAVKALQARVYMWAKKYTEAYNAADKVIASGKFPWATQSDLQSGADHSMVSEQIFGLNNINLTTLGDSYFNENYNSYSFSLTSSSLLSLYENMTADLRYLFLFKNGETGDYVDNRYMLKYVQSGSSDLFYQNKMPMMRIAEMYLIKAEAAYRENGDGLEEINDLRAARNVQPISILTEPFMDCLVKEYRKELIGEGQIFYLYKRINLQHVPGSDIDAVAQKIYTFPLPISETEHAACEPNR